jgi:hypothetical protein
MDTTGMSAFGTKQTSVCVGSISALEVKPTYGIGALGLLGWRTKILGEPRRVVSRQLFQFRRVVSAKSG